MTHHQPSEHRLRRSQQTQTKLYTSAPFNSHDGRQWILVKNTLDTIPQKFRLFLKPDPCCLDTAISIIRELLLNEPSIRWGAKYLINSEQIPVDPHASKIVCYVKSIEDLATLARAICNNPSWATIQAVGPAKSGWALTNDPRIQFSIGLRRDAAEIEKGTGEYKALEKRFAELGLNLFCAQTDPMQT